MGKHYLWMVTATMTPSDVDSLTNKAKPEHYEQVVATPTEDFLSHLAEINAALCASWSERPHKIRLDGFKRVWVEGACEVVVI